MKVQIDTEVNANVLSFAVCYKQYKINVDPPDESPPDVSRDGPTPAGKNSP